MRAARHLSANEVVELFRDRGGLDALAKLLANGQSDKASAVKVIESKVRRIIVRTLLRN